MASIRVLAVVFLCLPIVALACGDDGGHGGDGQPDGVGNHCDHDADCETDECYLGPAGGYCTSPCSDEGDESECPEDTVCKPIQGGARRCLLICGSETACDGNDGCADEHCPDASSCVSVDNTGNRACEPHPG